jgi:hypothetical protein
MWRVDVNCEYGDFTVKRKNTKWRHLRTNVEVNILTLERDGTCTVHGAVRNAHKITRSMEQIPS